MDAAYAYFCWLRCDVEWVVDDEPGGEGGCAVTVVCSAMGSGEKGRVKLLKLSRRAVQSYEL